MVRVKIFVWDFRLRGWVADYFFGLTVNLKTMRKGRSW